MSEKEVKKPTWHERHVVPFYKFAILFLVIILIISFLSDVFDRCYYVQEVDSTVLAQLVQVSPEELTSRIKDEMDQIYDQAHSLKGLHPRITNLTNPFDVDLGGLSTSYFTLVNFVKGKLGLENTNLSGAVYGSREQLCLRSRIGDELIEVDCMTFDSSVTDINRYDEIMRRMALGIVSFSDPYISAMYHYKNGLYDHCITLAKKAMQKTPPAEKYALGTIGNAYRELGDFEKAESYYKQSIEKYPKFYPTYWQYGILYHMQGNYEAAVEQFDLAASKDEKMRKPALVSLLDAYCDLNQQSNFDFTLDQYLKIGQIESLQTHEHITPCLKK